MARTRNSTTRSRQNNRGRKKSSSLKWILLISLFVVLSLVIWGVVTMLNNNDYTFKRSDLDKYIEKTHNNNLLNNGISVYFDMSNGMNHAYSSVHSKETLKSVINKLAGNDKNDKVDFYSLANGRITSLELNHKDLFNYMIDSKNYAQQRAPIETTLDSIVKKKQPALLMTDFEEYHDNKIQLAAYAKKYFIDWLDMGYNITFYKWTFVEGKKNKYMFLAVFDDNMNSLNNRIKEAVRENSDIDTFVLGSRDFAYPTKTNYISSKKGGNYHNSKGNDIVTAVLEDGSSDSYFCYAKAMATAEGESELFTPLDNITGAFAEYYPIGVKWQDVIRNAKTMQKKGTPKADVFHHLLSNLYINFNKQDGYNIKKIEIRTFDMQETMRTIANSKATISFKEIEKINKPEIDEIFTANMEDCRKLVNWKHIFVDFHNNFNGTFIDEEKSSNLIRANIVISEVDENIEKAKKFFYWEGNPSLFNSVTETLQASTSKPIGRILYTYYVKTLAN